MESIFQSSSNAHLTRRGNPEVQELQEIQRILKIICSYLVEKFGNHDDFPFEIKEYLKKVTLLLNSVSKKGRRRTTTPSFFPNPTLPTGTDAKVKYKFDDEEFLLKYEQPDPWLDCTGGEEDDPIILLDNFNISWNLDVDLDSESISMSAAKIRSICPKEVRIPLIRITIPTPGTGSKCKTRSNRKKTSKSQQHKSTSKVSAPSKSICPKVNTEPELETLKKTPLPQKPQTPKKPRWPQCNVCPDIIGAQGGCLYYNYKSLACRNLDQKTKEAVLIKLSKPKPLKIPGPFKCDVCFKIVDTQIGLYNHKKVHGTNRTQFSCPLCPKVYKQKNNLRFHMNCHYGLKPFPCDICGRPFKTPNLRYHHMRTHSSINERFLCHLCPKTFYAKQKLIYHIKTVHEGQRLYKVPKGVRPYACNYCTSKFGRSGDLNRHVRQKHPENVIPVVEPEAQPNTGPGLSYADRCFQFNLL